MRKPNFAPFGRAQRISCSNPLTKSKRSFASPTCSRFANSTPNWTCNAPPSKTPSLHVPPSFAPRSRSWRKTANGSAVSKMNKKIIDDLLSAMITSRDGVSDLLFTADKPPLVEAHGWLEEFPVETPEPVFGPREIDELATHIIGGDERLTRDLASSGSCDCSYALADLARFRVNIFKQKGRQAIVMRKLQSEIPTLEGLGLPPIFREMTKEKSGIVFVTGATGSGKTTTLAAMLNEINQTQQIHIVTLEDPIEFMHPHQRAVFHQRELGKDFPDFARGLRAALRQAPKVILVGEIRDRETMEIAMTASETGHVVFATLHTISAGQTINRILGMFGKDEEQSLRQR